MLCSHPLSIWNDRPYDEHAIYTGSATVVDGKVFQVYPGLCYPQFSDCEWRTRTPRPPSSTSL